MITLTPHLGRKRAYKTLDGARRAASRMLAAPVTLDPDGYAVGKGGKCLFFHGCSFGDLFDTGEP